MKIRLISAGIGIVIGALVFVFGEMNSIVITIAVTIVGTVMCGEYLVAKNLHHERTIFIPVLALSALIISLPYTCVGFIPYFAFVLYLCVIAVLRYNKIPIENIFYTFFGISLITLSMALFNIRVCAANWHPTFWAVLIFGVPWIADSAAYFVGSAMGKRKLCPEISPKKTVEGAVGGVIFAALIPLLFGWIFKLAYGNLEVNWLILPVIGLVNAVISIFGDLLFSVIKRKCGIKDYGSIMPGHGGLLDRFDSVILCVPFVYFISKYVPIITDIIPTT